MWKLLLCINSIRSMTQSRSLFLSFKLYFISVHKKFVVVFSKGILGGFSEKQNVHLNHVSAWTCNCTHYLCILCLSSYLCSMLLHNASEAGSDIAEKGWPIDLDMRVAGLSGGVWSDDRLPASCHRPPGGNRYLRENTMTNVSVLKFVC